MNEEISAERSKGRYKGFECEVINSADDFKYKLMCPHGETMVHGLDLYPTEKTFERLKEDERSE